MRDERQRRSARSLERPSRLRPAWRRRLLRLAMVVGLCGLSAVILGRRFDTIPGGDRSDCAATFRTAPADLAVRTCQREYEHSKDPRTGARLAHVLKKAGDVENARRMATSLLATVARADALYVLGYIAYDEDKYEAAIAYLEEARILHRILRERLGLARDDTVLASVWTDRSEYLKALLLLDECIENTQDRDRSQEWHCHTNAARTLVSLGYFTAAKEELDSAHALATSEEDRKYVEYQRGNLAQESGNTESAIESFRAVLRPGEHPVNANTALLTEQNLAYALAETGNLANLDEAQLHLDNATRLDRGHDQTAERTWTAAQIAYKRGELARATSLTKRYFDVIDVSDDVDRDDRIDVASLQARIELQRNDLQGAESTAQRAVDEAELVRRKQSVLALRAPVLSKRRAPYELRFIALARQGQVEKAALAFDQWQGRSVQDALAKKPEREPSHHSDIAEQITRLGPWIGALTTRT